MNDFSMDSFVNIIVLLIILGLGLYFLIKCAVKSAIRELEKEKDNNK
ncbi:MAG: hypothetical protein RR585_07590 [Coprobacillus sp.]